MTNVSMRKTKGIIKIEDVKTLYLNEEFNLVGFRTYKDEACYYQIKDGTIVILPHLVSTLSDSAFHFEFSASLRSGKLLTNSGNLVITLLSNKVKIEDKKCLLENFMQNISGDNFKKKECLAAANEIATALVSKSVINLRKYLAKNEEILLPVAKCRSSLATAWQSAPMGHVFFMF